VGLKTPKNNSTKFKEGHAKMGGRTKGTPNKMQILEVPVPLDKISSVTEALKKYGVDPVIEILKLCGMVPDGVQRWPLMAHQKASILLQLAAMQKREAGGNPSDPQTPTVPPGTKPSKEMSTDELLKRVLRATHDEQLRSATGG